MKIKVFTLEKMKENGCFWMTMPNGAYGEDKETLFYDPKGKIKSEKDYLKLSEHKMINFQMSSYECFYDDELDFIKKETEIEINDMEYNNGERYFAIDCEIGIILMPRLPGVLYEEC